MSPTIYRFRKFRFFFFSREEPRKHVHVASADGEAKFWLEPVVALAEWQGLTSSELRELQQIVEDKQDDFRNSWIEHFEGS